MQPSWSHPATAPPQRSLRCPLIGDGVLAVVTVQGKPVAPIVSKVIHFSGYDWNVRTASNDRGGEPNAYAPDNAWVDAKGYLHLRMQQRNGEWTCAEVSMTRSLGYGSYIFVVQDTGHLSPIRCFGLIYNR